MLKIEQDTSCTCLTFLEMCMKRLAKSIFFQMGLSFCDTNLFLRLPMTSKTNGTPPLFYFYLFLDFIHLNLILIKIKCKNQINKCKAYYSAFLKSKILNKSCQFRRYLIGMRLRQNWKLWMQIWKIEKSNIFHSMQYIFFTSLDLFSILYKYLTCSDHKETKFYSQV